MLDRYEAKRDFDRTPEPRGGDGPAWGSLRFVVQKHAARRLHYDVRLEIGGTLKSWPVPKGPSFDPNEKRLAVMVEDHPLDYLTFEAVIAPGNYGAGQMIVWDTGVYSPDEDGVLSFGDRETSDRRMREGLAAGKLSFTLRGRKLRGSWTLVKTSRGEREWLLIKHKDAHARISPDVLDEGASVLSKLTIDDLKAGRLPDPTPLERRLARCGTEARFPSSVKPMLAKLTEGPFDGDGWLFEPKMDGFRLLAFVDRGAVRLRSRTGNDMTGLYPEVVEELRAQPHESFVLDGEVVVLDEAGLPSFGLMQQRMGGPRMAGAPRAEGALMYYPFDLLYLDGYNVRGAPLSERKGLLARMLAPGDVVRPIEYVVGGGKAFFAAATGLGLEGVMAKRLDSMYQPGRRGNAWLKIKATQSQEMVVGGYSAGAGARASTFGSLLVGYYDDGVLRFAARVGTGFDQAALDDLHERMQPLRIEEMPFAPDPELGIPGDVWLRPELVARVKFAEWSLGGHLRGPVFLGLEPDRDPRSVVRERPAAGPSPARARAIAGHRAPTGGAPTGGSGSGGGTLAEESAAAVEQLADEGAKDGSMAVNAGGHVVRVTNLDKALWPETAERTAITKRDMLAYYARVAPALLSHLRDRPLTLTRYPNGVDAPSFYQKNWTYELPEFVETVKLFSSHNEGDVEYVMVNNLATLLWLAQLADIEMHPWLSRRVPGPDGAGLGTGFTGSKENIEASILNYPDFLVFDLDPYIYSGEEGAGAEPELNRRAFVKAVETARALKGILDQLSLSSFLKTSGKTGLHVYVPVRREHPYPVTRKVTELIGRFLMEQRPLDVTMEWAVSKREGKIFLDHNQNVRGKNMASVYSLRPLPGAPVSTPLRWDELDDVYPADLTIDVVPGRVERVGDLWAGIHEAKHDLRRLVEGA